MSEKNNFHFLRFLFAVFVVISHAYPLSGTDESLQWIYKLTNGQIVLARLGLDGFFIISGYFIYKSLQRSKSLLNYYKKRILRLFPALAIVLMLCLIFVPLVYHGIIPIYQNRQYYTYLPNNLSLYNFQGVIKGVFNDNPYHAINGSLWTIRYEFSLYLALSMLYVFRNQKIIDKIVLSCCLISLWVIYNFYLSRFAGASVFGILGYEILDLGTFFISGSLLAAFNFETIKEKWVLFLAIILTFVSIYFDFYGAFKHITLPVFILMMGFMPLPFFSTFGRVGDMSYGIYIYSFPVQQTLMYFFKSSLYELMVWSLIISIILGYLSWHLIEKRALKFKNIPIFKKNIF